jgi:hypothetical protein
MRHMKALPRLDSSRGGGAFATIHFLIILSLSPSALILPASLRFKPTCTVNS